MKDRVNKERVYSIEKNKLSYHEDASSLGNAYQFMPLGKEASLKEEVDITTNHDSKRVQLQALQDRADTHESVRGILQLQTIANQNHNSGSIDDEVIQRFSLKKLLLGAMVAGGHLLDPQSFANAQGGASGALAAGPSAPNWQSGQSPFSLPENEDLLHPLLDDLNDMFGPQDDDVDLSLSEVPTAQAHGPAPKKKKKRKKKRRGR